MGKLTRVFRSENFTTQMPLKLTVKVTFVCKYTNGLILKELLCMQLEKQSKHTLVSPT